MKKVNLKSSDEQVIKAHAGKVSRLASGWWAVKYTNAKGQVVSYDMFFSKEEAIFWAVARIHVGM